MIVECINCNKKFNVDPKLIPENGRKIQCGSCNYNWFYKIKEPSATTLVLADTNTDSKMINENKSEMNNDLIPENITTKNDKVEKINNDLKSKSHVKIKNNITNKFFSYLLVFIISFVMLIILLDTLKIFLINMFPSLEIVLFSLFETIKDIKLFIIDLT